VRVEEKGGFPDDGLKLPDTPDGSPERLSATFWADPEASETVIE
jgi:hypothetical protein